MNRVIRLLRLWVRRKSRSAFQRHLERLLTERAATFAEIKARGLKIQLTRAELEYRRNLAARTGPRGQRTEDIDRSYSPPI